MREKTVPQDVSEALCGIKALSCQLQPLPTTTNSWEQLRRQFPSSPASGPSSPFSMMLHGVPQPQCSPALLFGAGCQPCWTQAAQSLLFKGWICHGTCTKKLRQYLFPKERTEEVYTQIKAMEHNALISEKVMTLDSNNEKFSAALELQRKIHQSCKAGQQRNLPRWWQWAHRTQPLAGFPLPASLKCNTPQNKGRERAEAIV